MISSDGVGTRIGGKEVPDIRVAPIHPSVKK
jgi:hypothetical protein